VEAPEVKEEVREEPVEVKEDLKEEPIISHPEKEAENIQEE
jgi:hypothetical protein